MSRIFLTGDTHRDIDIGKLDRLNRIIGNELTKDDYLIVLGDFGVVWRGLDTEEDRAFVRRYEDMPWTTLFIDGNHENHDELTRLPVEGWCGGKIHRIGDSIIHLMRGQVFQIEGRSFFTMGGARSTDIDRRTPGRSWWEGEMPTQEEFDEALENLEQHGFSVQYVLTHTIGRPATDDPLERFLYNLDNYSPLTYNHWYYGHFHMDRKTDDCHTVMYQDIIEL